ncbi:hypothetical protein NDU88_002261 [Pleurodeles waltl]|uniref:Uncharacterized protein n=1 Tax=Pleurodeles waltl TaxID=8319 RepID=A0AAV7UBU2_PLEWA|nr:hypothetical protein NDU88_002261 [Pleurodeles waltl]
MLLRDRGVAPTGIAVPGGQRPGMSELHRGLVATPRWKPQEEHTGKWENRWEMAPGKYEGAGLEVSWLDYDEENVEEGEIREDLEEGEQGWWEEKSGELLTLSFSHFGHLL